MRYAEVPPQLCVGPFTTGMARAAGLSAAQLKSLPWRHICRDVYVHDEIPDSLDLRLAVVRLILPPGAVVSGTSAAWLHGVDVRRLGEPLEVTAPRGTTLQSRRGLLRPRQALLPASDIVEIRGVPVTTPLRTAFDLARLQPLVEGVVGVDALLHKRLLSQDELMAYAAEHPGWRGVREVGRVVELSEPLTESPMESRLRLLLVVDGGLPRPTAQYEVFDQDGILVARFDFGYPIPRVGVDFDGRVHEQTETRVADAQRHNRLLNLKWTPLRYTGRAFYRTPRLIIAEVRAAISDLGPGEVLGA